MKTKNFLMIFLILSPLFSSQTNAQLQDSVEQYFNLINQRLLLNGDESLGKIASFFQRNNNNFSNQPLSSLWQIESYTRQFWNSSNWQNDSSEVFTYNPNDLRSEKRIRDWSGSQWIDKYRYLYLYDASLRKSTMTEQFKVGGSWYDSLKKVYDYNSQGLLNTETTYRWTNGGWENWSLMTSFYINNKLIEDIHQDWNGSSWENSSRTTYEYSTFSTSSTFSIWLFGTWINLLRIVFYSDANGLITEFRLQIWDFLSGWANLTRILFTYDNNYNIIEGLRQDWDFDTSSWINYSRITSTYNAFNLPEADLTEFWTDNSYWVKSYLSTHTHDSNSNLTETIGQHWSGSIWINSIRDLFTYIDVSPVELGNLNPNEFKLIGNYPNPFNPTTTIKFNIPEASMVTLKVYNSIGQEVAVLLNNELTQGTYEIVWNADSFTSGVYCYQLHAEKFIETKKMILLR